MHTRSSWCWCCCLPGPAAPAGSWPALLIAIIAVAISVRDRAHSAHPKPSPHPVSQDTTSRAHRPPGRQPGRGRCPWPPPDRSLNLGQLRRHGKLPGLGPPPGPATPAAGWPQGSADTPRGSACWRPSTSGVRTAGPVGHGQSFRPTIHAPGSPARTARPRLLRAENAGLRPAARPARPGSAPAAQPGGGYAAEAGYRFVAWSPASATVEHPPPPGPTAQRDHRAGQQPGFQVLLAAGGTGGWWPRPAAKLGQPRPSQSLR